jgi:hypothetical protein
VIGAERREPEEMKVEIDRVMKRALSDFRPNGIVLLHACRLHCPTGACSAAASGAKHLLRSQHEKQQEDLLITAALFHDLKFQQRIHACMQCCDVITGYIVIYPKLPKVLVFDRPNATFKAGSRRARVWTARMPPSRRAADVPVFDRPNATFKVACEWSSGLPPP